MDSKLMAGLVSTLQEIDPRYLKQTPGPLTVRYFRGQGIELHLWQDTDGSLDHVHFIVGTRALVWSRRRGFVLGEAEQDQRGPGTTGMMPAAEIIRATGELDGMRDILAMVAEGGAVDAELKQRLLQLLAALPAAGPAGPKR